LVDLFKFELVNFTFTFHNNNNNNDNDNNNNTESQIISAQDQALQTKYLARKILETENGSKCRLCKQFDKAVEHIIETCPLLAKQQYIQRHDIVCAELHCNTFKEIGVILDNKHWYDHVPELDETSHEGNVTILRNQKVRTDRTIPNNRSDIIIRNNKKEHAC
jgi:hypothetical protein